jgi:hypothetical protein
MIHGAHVIVYSKESEADRAFFRDVLGYSFADAGHGWLIFALPPAEVAVHPSDENDVHELYLMCDDVHGFIAEMQAKGVACSDVHEERWGSITRVALPGGGKIGVYQPKHPSPLAKASGPKKAKAKAKKKSKSAKAGAKAAAKKKAAPRKSAARGGAKAKKKRR